MPVHQTSLKRKSIFSNKPFWLFILFFPIAIYFLYIAYYGVNTIFWDEWDTLPMIHHFLSGSLTFADLWNTHNENRMLFPNLFFLFNVEIDNYNTKIEMFVGGILLLLSFYIMTKIFRARIQKEIFWITPIAFLLFSLSQYENTLWGFQFAWYLILACLVLELYLLEQKENWGFWLSILLAICASYSSFQGLFLWLAGFVYILLNGCSGFKKVTWTVATLIFTGLYFMGKDLHDIGGSFYPLSHPIESLKFFLISIGSVIPVSLGYIQPPAFGYFPVEFIGAIFLSLGTYVIVQGIRASGTDKGYLFPVALCVYAFLFDLALLGGRQQLGLLQATVPHYTTYNLLLVIGIYMGIVNMLKNASFTQKKTVLYPLMGVVCLLSLTQVLVSYYVGINEGQEFFRSRIKSAKILANYSVAPDMMVTNYVTGELSLFRKEAPTLSRYRLSIFDSPTASLYAKEGLPLRILPYPPQLSQLLRTDTALSQAWLLLSEIYDTRGDLQKAFPKGSPQYISKLLEWTLSDTDSLRQLVDKYRTNLTYIKNRLQGQLQK